jgi:FixJ family two-component response regulator
MEVLGPERQKTIVVVDDDRDIAEVVQTILIDEGFTVSCLYQPTKNDVKAAIDRLEPDCVLLDGGNPAAYGPSWEIAAWLAARPHPVPAVMITGHSADRDEAVRNETDRARMAHVAGVIPKPFDIDRLITTVCNAVGQPVTTITDRQEADHQNQLLARLKTAGVVELSGSLLGRVWATVRAGSEHTLYKIYRWRAAGAYFIGRYSADGHQMEPLGQFADVDALVAYCLNQLKVSRLS